MKESIDATVQSGPNGERGVMCFLSDSQLEELGVKNDAEHVSYYVDDGKLAVED